MVLSIEWTDFAKQELYSIFVYHKNRASVNIAHKLVLGIRNRTLVLLSTPEIGQIEESLHKKDYRYLVFKSYKIIYRVYLSKKMVVITDVFDTRQNPIKISRNK